MYTHVTLLCEVKEDPSSGRIKQNLVRRECGFVHSERGFKNMILVVPNNRH